MTAAGFCPDQNLRFSSTSNAEFSEQDAKKVLANVYVWQDHYDVQREIERIASDPLPLAGGMAQLLHLAALVHLADFAALMDYQKAFRAGRPHGFVPMIKAKTIDRAIELAVDRL